MHCVPRRYSICQTQVKTGWWQHPGESDILGIDDPTSTAFNALVGASSVKGKSAGKKIAIIAPPKESDRIRGVLERNFTGTELNRAVKDRGIVIYSGDPGRGNSGFYKGRQPYNDTPTIVVMPDASEETITHEFIHHMRRVDATRGDIARSPFPVDEDGYTRYDRVRQMSESDQRTLTNVEEAATVAESASRIYETGRACGYYQETGSEKNRDFDDIQRQWKEDRAIMTTRKDGTTKPTRGKSATKTVNTKFKDTNISKLRVRGSGRVPRNEVDSMIKNGTIPKAEKAKPKKAAGTRGMIGSPPGRAMAEATKRKTSSNRKVKR